MLVVLIDDAGFGSSSAFGGPCQTPTFERLASNGLRYNRFHTTALCSPTRQALLTGRNHHAVGMGGITEIATSAPGYNSLRPNTAAPLAETLKLNGYSTAQFGKCHEVPVWETSPMGPFDDWPTGGGGFEHFYGFIGGETNQYAPAIYDGTTPVEPDRTPEEGYHFTEDMTDHAIDWVRQQKALMPDKPFFVYFAPGATHAPHHVPPEWSAKYKGRFDAGWDALREETFARQKELGRGPRGRRAHRAPRRDPGVGRHARRPEAGAGPPDGGLRRLHGAHRPPRRPAGRRARRARDPRRHAGLRDRRRQRRLGRGHAQRLLQRAARPQRRRRLETAEFMASRIDEFGTPEAYNHYAVGWAHAMDTPYQWTKQVASHWGGTRNGTIVHWPNGIAAKGEVRTQFHHVIDVAADRARGGRPARSRPSSTASSRCRCTACAWPTRSTTPAAAERHETQYFEMFCNRGIYHKGWTAVTRHSTPWVMAPSPPLDDDVWELYAPDDWTQAHDLAAEQPEKLPSCSACS